MSDLQAGSTTRRAGAKLARTLIRGGTIVNAWGRHRADVMICGETVVAVGDLDVACETVLDASGALLLPGAVDPHTHILSALDRASESALLGGTTTALVFVDAEANEEPARAAQRVIAEQLPSSRIDIALHAVIWEPQRYRRGQLAAVVEQGVRSVKLWLAYPELGIMADDGKAFAVMQEAAELSMVVLAHCENGPVIEVLSRDLLQAGQSGIEQLPRSRPPELEAEAVHRFLALARLAGALPYVVHVSGAQALEQIELARTRRRPVYGEVCTHHLLFDERRYQEPDAQRYVVIPPLRPAQEPDNLWRALADGRLDTLGSDHGQRALAPTAPASFAQAPAGLPGIGARLAAAFAAGVGAGRISVERLVDVACAAPARIFGLYPKKGTIAPGADADIVVWDPGATHTLTADSIGDGLGWTPYEGLAVPGAIDTVLARGALVVRHGQLVGAAHRGRYLAR